MKHLVQSLAAIQTRLKEAGVESAVIGAMALAVWGQPRLTRDADLKVLLTRDDAQRLLDILGAGYLPIQPDPLGALRGNGVAFFRDAQASRIDLLLADVGFDERAIRRAVEVNVLDEALLRVATAEDLIIYKLISTREMDHIDAASVVRRQGGKLDHSYVLNWLRQFELALDDSTLVAEYERLRAKWG
ncbi:MAG: hypothetical protein HY784_09820 [Chloroflexi bacterium]|nr:hypothetical protein [Chloroflexota bacterium]